MAKDKITDYSATAASNTDIGGVNIQGSAAISNADNAFREQMSHLAETNAGTYPVDDTWTFCDPADRTKKFRFDGVGVTAGQTRVLTVPDSDGTLLTSATVPFTAASASGAASLAFAEDTDNGAHTVTLKAPASVAASVDVMLPGTAGTLATLEAPAFTTTIALTGDITPTQITADQNNYAPTDHATASTFRLSSDAARTITGLAGGSDGRIVILHNIGSFAITLEDQSASSTAANGFITLGGVWTNILPGSSLVLQYDATSSRWRTVSPALLIANQSTMETATSASHVVGPANMHFHPATPKCWGEFTGNSTTILKSYNITSVADTATGVMTVTIANDFSDENWACFVCKASSNAGNAASALYDSKAAGSVVLRSIVEGGAGEDPSATSGNASWSFMGMGDL